MNWLAYFKRADRFGKGYLDSRRAIIKGLREVLREVIPDIEVCDGFGESGAIVFISDAKDAEREKRFKGRVERLMMGGMKWEDAVDKAFDEEGEMRKRGELIRIEDLVNEIFKRSGLEFECLRFEGYFDVTKDEAIRIEEVLREWLMWEAVEDVKL
jgi:hypothetical protein